MNNANSSGGPVIEIVIDASGQSTLTAKGFSSASCRDATRPLEQALGLVQSDRPTAEMYQSAPTQAEAKQSRM